MPTATAEAPTLPAYGLTGEAASAAARAAEIAGSVVAREADAVDREGRFPRTSIDALGKAGLLGIVLPKDAGGLGLTPSAYAEAVESVAKACASTGMIYVMHVCAAAVVAANRPKDSIVRDMASGKHLTTLAFSEKGSRSHFWAPVSRETTSISGTTLNADKSWVTSAGEADSYIVSTEIATAKAPTESILYLVKKGASGLTVSSRFDGLGLRGNSSAPMTLRNVAVTKAEGLCEPGKGFDTMLGVVLPWFQLGSAAVSLGIAQAAMDATVNHLKSTRLEHMNENLTVFANLRTAVARMGIEIERSRAQVAYTARAMEAPAAHTMGAVLASKAQAADTALSVTDLAMQACGGAAFSKQLPLERHFRDARAASVMSPTTDHLHDFLGKAFLGLPLF